ncbi:hypothetical protein [Mucilaginibacter flavus]|uniref:hypothetical protein n=1 Tax=Mucilaginibacter flavus TaxID=931504 RepID=UPI0025B363E6|nr:hypothetical protein [Mucilaginibacter flavus]MDN3584945.1 hypothetical protein [Mucilaginibacter flavus]
MERFKIKCEILQKPVELQFDIKKMPGEIGPCYMVTVDGLFRGYIKKEKTGMFGQLMNSDFDEEVMLVINSELKKLLN